MSRGAGFATVVFLSLKLGRPLFLEGEAGVGKTEIARTLASALGRRLIRLQCYEGLDAASAVYEWNFPAQMVAIRTAEATGEAAGAADRKALTEELFSERFLIRRPLLEAMQPQPGGPPVLLIDEIDRTDEPFEAFLLEALSDFQVTIPELGTLSAAAPPIVILTSNRTREVHDALKRRCLYHWVEYPDFARELAILRARAPEATEALSREVVAFVQRLREEDLFKKPGVAETIDWAKCLVALDAVELSPQVIADTLGALLKYQDDIARLQGSESRGCSRRRRPRWPRRDRPRSPDGHAAGAAARRGRGGGARHGGARLASRRAVVAGGDGAGRAGPCARLLCARAARRGGRLQRGAHLSRARGAGRALARHRQRGGGGGRGALGAAYRRGPRAGLRAEVLRRRSATPTSARPGGARWRRGPSWRSAAGGGWPRTSPISPARCAAPGCRWAPGG